MIGNRQKESLRGIKKKMRDKNKCYEEQKEGQNREWIKRNKEEN